MIRQSDYENYDYRQFWDDNKRAYEDIAERIVIRKFLKDVTLHGKIFADLGCGYGRLFDEYKNCRKAILVDYSLNNLKNAKERISGYLKDDANKLSNILFVVADVNKLPFKKNIIDACLTVRVIHHLDEPGKYFLEVARILKPGGLFLIEFANKRNIKNILKFIFGRLKLSPFNKKPLQIGETILDYHPKHITSLLKYTGFFIIRKISASNFRLAFLKKHLSLKVLLFFENFYQDIFSFIDTGSIFLKTILKDIPGNDKTGNDVSCDDEFVNGLSGSYSIDLEKIFACPSCHMGNLKIQKNAAFIYCGDCGKEFSIIDGIYVFKN